MAVMGMFSKALAKDGNLLLSKDAHAFFTIALAHDAIPAERTPAAQLQKYLRLVTGADFVIQDENDVPADKPQIVVGAGQRAKGLPPQEDWVALGTDGIVIKTIDGNLILAGGQARGTLYAVFQFLEETVGCQWWTSTEQFIPKVTELSIPLQNVRYVPHISYREHFSTRVRYHPEFATRTLFC